MPKLVCPCGYVHDLSPIPDDGWVLVRDRDYEALLAWEARREALGKALPGSADFDSLVEADAAVNELTERQYECPGCGRLARGNGAAFRCFRAES
ncbi:MAG: hypothetical protein IPJ34_06025 [Myxococcales bacterium]|nr:hypothetical protein [Myxococcales bacterium]